MCVCDILILHQLFRLGYGNEHFRGQRHSQYALHKQVRLAHDRWTLIVYHHFSLACSVFKV